jgi:hypothetical protein
MKTLPKSLWTKDDIIKIMKDDFTWQTYEEVHEQFLEIAEALLPFYDSEIIGEWQSMPSNYHGRGVEELGLPETITVYNLMTKDLFFYYRDLVSEAFIQLEKDGCFSNKEEN